MDHTPWFVRCDIHLVTSVGASTVGSVGVEVVTAAVVVAALVGGAVVAAVELSIMDAWDGFASESLSAVVIEVVTALEWAVVVSYFAPLLSGVVVEAWTMDSGVKLLAGVNRNGSAVVMTALEFPVSMPCEEFRC